MIPQSVFFLRGLLERELTNGVDGFVGVCVFAYFLEGKTRYFPSLWEKFLGIQIE